MRLTYQVSVDLDPHYVSRKAAEKAVKDGDFTTDLPATIRHTLATGIEDALHDALIHKAGIIPGSVRAVRSETNGET